MKSFSTVAAFALALGVLADKTVTTTCVQVSTTTCWSTSTAYSTINVCTPISTVVTPCGACAPATVTAWTQPITSTTTSKIPTSTYCPTPGYYTECACTVPTPQWIYYEQPCDVEYVCPYVDWYYMPSKPVVVIVKVNGKPKPARTETWTVGPTGIVKPTAIVTYIPNPTIIVINDITINVTAAPTYITYTSSVTTTVTTTATVAPTGVAVSTFKLSGTFNGEPVVVLQEGGSLVVAPASDDTDAGFTLTSTGELLASGGGLVSVTFVNGVGSPFTYGGVAKRGLDKRAIADGTYFGTFSASGTFAMTIDGSSVTIQVCAGNVLSGGDGVMSGCAAITLQAVPVDTPLSSSLPSSAPSSAPATSMPISSSPTSEIPSSAFPSSAPTEFPSSSPVSAGALPTSAPSSIVSIPLTDIIPSSIL